MGRELQADGVEREKTSEEVTCDADWSGRKFALEERKDQDGR